MMQYNVFYALHLILLLDILKLYCDNIFRNLKFHNLKFVNYKFASFKQHTSLLQYTKDILNKYLNFILTIYCYRYF